MLTVSVSTITPKPLPEPFMRQGLPAGWEMYQTKSGRLYYIDYNTKTISTTRRSPENPKG